MLKKWRLLPLVALLLLPMLAWSLPKVAVLDLTVQKGIDASVVAPVTESVMEEVVGARAYVVLDRAYIEQILKEKEFQLSGMVSDTQVAQAGQYLGADYVVAGKIQLVGDTYFIVAKMIEVKTGVIVAQSSEQGEGKLAVLLTLARTVGKKLVTGAPISALAPATAAAATAAKTAPAAETAAAAVPAAETPQATAAAEGVAPKGDDAVPEGQVTISILALRDPQAPDAGAWNAVMDAFRAKYPNINLVEENAKDPGPYNQKLNERIRAGKTPDVFMLESGQQRPGIKARDLGPMLGDRRGLFLEPVVRLQGGDRGIYYLPDSVTASHVLYANGALLEKLGLRMPETIADLIAQAPIIKKAGLIPIAMTDKDGWQAQSCLLSVLASRMGGMGWVSRAISGRDASFKDAPFVEALGAIKRLNDAKMFPPNYLSIDYSAPLQMFASSKSVYMIDGAWRAGELAGRLRPEEKERLIIGALPDFIDQAGMRGSTTAVVRGYSINADIGDKKAAAAWLWIWFLSGPEGQKIRFERGGHAFATIDPRRFMGGVDPIWERMYDFLAAAPIDDIIDMRMNPEPVNRAIKDVVGGAKKPAAAAADVEAFVARNEPARKK
jgi:raffinose/stachyose/melibiose transport system substrate-binding protein